jgi:8-oxo-dGTP diphosphatase
MDKFRNAVKGFIVNDNKVLLVKRRANDPTKPNTWDIPGGRLEIGENPYSGLKREIKEETQLNVEIEVPIGIHHFTREDGQNITMIIFLCEAKTNSVVIDEENQDFKWVFIDEARDLLHKAFYPDIDAYKKYFEKKKIK